MFGIGESLVRMGVIVAVLAFIVGLGVATLFWWLPNYVASFHF